MTTSLASRLGAALAARQMKPADLIRQLGVSKGAVYNILNGTTHAGKMRADTIARMSRILGVRQEWLSTGLGPMEGHESVGDSVGIPVIRAPSPPVSEYEETERRIPASAFRRVPIVGTASMGMDGFWVGLDYPAGHGDGYFNVLTEDPDAYVVGVRGDSMHPAIRSGWYVLAEPSAPLHPGEYVIVQLVDGRSTVKELLWHRGGAYTLHAVASGERLTIPEDEVEKIHHIGAILPPSGRMEGSSA